jgi:hypothetical protein
MGQVVRGSRKIGLRERIKSVRIQATGTQFQNNTPSTITLKAVAQNFEAISYAWYKGTVTTVVGTNQNFVIAHDQVSTVETYRVVVKNNQNQEYEDSISITKVIDGPQGRPGQLPIQREWRFGDVYRNNDEVIDYIYHRATDSWWKLKPGYNNVIAGINPSNAFMQLNSLEQLAVNILIAENANIAGLIFKNEKLISQTLASNGSPNIEIDGKNGELKCYKVEAKGGSVGALEIASNGLSYRFDSLSASNYAKRYNIDMRFEDGSKAAIGYDAIFSLSGYVKGVGTFVCSYNRGLDPHYNTKPGDLGYPLSPMNVGLLVSAKGATRNHALFINDGDIAGNALYTKFIQSFSSYDMTDESVLIFNGIYNDTVHIGLPKGADLWDGRTVTIMQAGNGYFTLYPVGASLYHTNSRFVGPGQNLHFGSYGTRMTLTYSAQTNTWYITSINSF